MFAACASYAKIIEKFKSHFEGNSATAARTHARMGGRTHANKHTHANPHRAIPIACQRAAVFRFMVGGGACAAMAPHLAKRHAVRRGRCNSLWQTRPGAEGGQGSDAARRSAFRYFAAAGDSIAGLRCVRLVCSNEKGEMCALRRRLVLSVRSGYSQAGPSTRGAGVRESGTAVPVGRSHGSAGIPLMQM